jgi:hypothetical protein
MPSHVRRIEPVRRPKSGEMVNGVWRDRGYEQAYDTPFAVLDRLEQRSRRFLLGDEVTEAMLSDAER